MRIHRGYELNQAGDPPPNGPREEANWQRIIDEVKDHGHTTLLNNRTSQTALTIGDDGSLILGPLETNNVARFRWDNGGVYLERWFNNAWSLVTKWGFNV